MKSSDLMFVGIKGSVVALNRATGEQAWTISLPSKFKGRGFVNLVVENGELLAACDGEIFCLDPLTGNVRWHNPLKGFGTGLATIATASSQQSAAFVAAQAEIERQSAAATTATTG